LFRMIARRKLFRTSYLVLIVIFGICYTGWSQAYASGLEQVPNTETKKTAETIENKETTETLDTTIRLLTYNIHHGADPADTFNLDATIETIRKSGANIIALQEVDRGWGGRSQNYDEAQYIADQLGMNYVYGAMLDKSPTERGSGEYGVMLLSKFVIVAKELYLLPSQFEQRGVLSCIMQTPLGNIRVCCTHLGVSAEERMIQIAALLDWLPQQEELLIMGDFNATPDAAELQSWLSRFGDLQAQYGLGSFGTIYYQDHWERIDYIFGGSRWNPVNCQIMTDATSDHRPIYMELSWQSKAEH
jgi:endonuclease/exonuclease/phosphatase family metal-dependent hydrolase